MKTTHNETGVSPVVGVMLMLVVTIVIAALVSAFAGGFGSSEVKTPQATISGTFSQSHGLTFTHTGGEGMTTGNLLIQIRMSTQIYQDADHWIAPIAHQNITDVTGLKNWKDHTSAFMPGDTAYVDTINSSASVLFPQFNSYANKGYTYSEPVNIGKTLTLELYDIKTNKMIAKTDMIIKA